MAELNRRDFIGRVSITGAGLLMLQAGVATTALAGSARGRTKPASHGDLADNFASPPFDCGPWVYWFWLDVNVTRAGITADLEAMKAVGIAGVTIFDVNTGTPPSFNGAKFGDPHWYELFKFASSEAHRLGMRIDMNNGAGWCGSGGPWITPELSMQQVVSSSAAIIGGTRFDAVLPQPQTNLNFYRDIAVIAVPTEVAEDPVTVTASSFQPGYPPTNVADGNSSTLWVSKGWNPGQGPTPQKPEWLRFAFVTPFRANHLRLTLRPDFGPRQMEVQSSDNGREWKTLTSATVPNAATALITFSEVAARYFRILILSSYENENVQMYDALFGSHSQAVDEANAIGFTIRNIQDLDDQNTEYNFPAPTTWPVLSANKVIPRPSVIDISRLMDQKGRLTWDAPAGRWTILRFGYTTTGMVNHPAPAGGLGLESDKLSRKATQVQFNALMERLIKTVGPLAGEDRTLVSTHIDSWESGSQNWTPTFLGDFKRLRGYDILPYLPVFTGKVVESLEISERFLWDVRQTVGDLLVENYAAAMREIAGKHGLRLSIEAYAGEPASDMRYGGQAVEPMAECWSWQRFAQCYSVTEMTSTGHVYGHNIIGQETFTANLNEKWQGYPAVVKDIGDWCFGEGINRFYFHRFAMQPWTNPHYAPGMCMGPWGLHYERTETWWHLTRPWHEYVARCCYLLRQGHFVADVCYMQAEGAPRQFNPPGGSPKEPYLPYSNYMTSKDGLPGRPGYNFDGCPPEVVLHRMEYKDGFLTLPGGMKYRVLVLPKSRTMTPQLLKKIKRLVDAGATVIGPRPQKSPSLANYPHCDAEVETLAEELWGNGKIASGKTADEVLAARGIKPDFQCDQPMVRWNHRRTADMDIYFIANGKVMTEYPYAGESLLARCAFRVTDAPPEFWDPETGDISPVPAYESSGGMTRIPVAFKPKGSVFVVFRHGKSPRRESVVRSVSRNGKTLLAVGANPHPHSKAPEIKILSASVSVAGQSRLTRDVTTVVQHLVDAGETSFQVVKVNALAGDPYAGAAKILDIHYEVDGRQDRVHVEYGIWLFNDRWVTLAAVGPTVPEVVALEAERNGGTRAIVTEPGTYDCVFATGKHASLHIPEIPAPVAIEGPWSVKFPTGWGAPDQIHLDKLIAWNKYPDAGVRYFSGTGEYQTEFEIPAELLAPHRRIYLDLGQVAVMARVAVNGQDMGILWKPPFKLDVTSVLKPGRNTLNIPVTNLWINRMIGDQQLPPDSKRAADGHLLQWPQWLLENKPSPTGRFTFTTWQLWHKTDPLVESGLIGPVKLSAAEVVAL